MLLLNSANQQIAKSTNVQIDRRQLSTNNGGDEKRVVSEGEAKLIGLLRARFPNAKHIDVVDISGGCGAMYTVYVETSEFRNMRTVRQHQMVNDVLLAEIKNNMHGLRIQTAVPSSSS
jgi:stress-induced morphogen